MAKGKKPSEYVTPQNILIAIVAFVFVFLVVLIGRSVMKRDQNVAISKDQIMIQKGGNTMIVNKDGLIEYRSGDKVFYRTWEVDRINSFFAHMESRARQYLANPPTNGIKCQHYVVTLYVDGEIVSVCIEDDEELDEIYEVYGEGDGDNSSLSDYFENGDDDGEDGSSDGLGGDENDEGESEEFPTPTPLQGGGGGGGDEDQDFIPPQSACERWASSIIDKAVISNILCTSGDEDE